LTEHRHPPLELEEVIHPSLRNTPIKPIRKVGLSCSEFRGYRARRNSIVLRIKSSLLIPTTVSFSVEAYLHAFTGTLILPGLQPTELTDFVVAIWATLPFDKKTMAVDFRAAARPPIKSLRRCFGRLYLRFDFNIHGAPFRYQIDQVVTVRPTHGTP
jgi:hypothetical protein